MMNFKKIVVANTAEAFLPLINKYDKQCRDQKLLTEHSLGERACFYGGDDKIVITSFPVPRMNSRLEAIGYSNVVNLFPSNPSASLSRDVINGLAAKLLDLFERGQAVDLISYVASDDLLDMILHIQCAGVSLKLIETPHRHVINIARQFDTKSGFRLLCSEWGKRSACIRMPFGATFDSPEHAARFVMNRLSQGVPCLCKADKGESGIGLAWFYPAEPHTEESVTNIIMKDRAFQGDLIVVEDVVLRPRIPVFDWSSPSVEVYVGSDGIPAATYTCCQRVDKGGRFSGILIDPTVIPSHIHEEANQIALLVGQELSTLGYRGYFDLDFVVDNASRLFLLEGNPRRTGGTHIHDLACYLLGQDYAQNHSVLSTDSLALGKAYEEEVLCRQIEDLLFPVLSTARGVVPTILGRTQDGLLGYAIFGNSLSDVLGQEEQLLKRLGVEH